MALAAVRRVISMVTPLSQDYCAANEEHRALETARPVARQNVYTGEDLKKIVANRRLLPEPCFPGSASRHAIVACPTTIAPWLPWPHESSQAGLSVSVPIEAGPFTVRVDHIH